MTSLGKKGGAIFCSPTNGFNPWKKVSNNDGNILSLHLYFLTQTANIRHAYSMLYKRVPQLRTPVQASDDMNRFHDHMTLSFFSKWGVNFFCMK